MRLPDGPQTPAFLQTINWILRPIDVLDARLREFGDCFRVLGKQEPPLIYFSSPTALQAIFTAGSSQLELSESNRVLLPLLGEFSLILLGGEPHQRQRQLLMPPFHGDRMRAYGQLMIDLTQQVMQQSQLNQAFAVRPTVQEISLRVILTAVFGLHEGKRFEQLRHLLSDLLETFNSPLSSFLLFYPQLQQDWGAWSPWGKFLRRREQIDRLLYAEIADRKALLEQTRRSHSTDREDILSLLLAAQDSEGQPMSEAEIRDELLTLLFAGHETTASAIAWALYWIHKLPAVQTKLLDELDALPAEAEPTAIARLPYLNAVCQETLRLYPIAINAFPRVVKQPLSIDGYDLPIGTVIIPSIYLAHQRESVFANPKQFCPDRFLERQYSPYEFLPFGGGDRRCIGLAFALYEMKLVLATLLRDRTFTLASDRPIAPVRRGLTIAPSRHLRLKAIELRPARRPAVLQ